MHVALRVLMFTTFPTTAWETASGHIHVLFSGRLFNIFYSNSAYNPFVDWRVFISQVFNFKEFSWK